MKNEPCAKLTIRVTPKISDSPAATRNSDDAPARPLSSCTTKPEKLMNNPFSAGDMDDRQALRRAWRWNRHDRENDRLVPAHLRRRVPTGASRRIGLSSQRRAAS